MLGRSDYWHGCKTQHYLCRRNAVDKADLLEAFLTHGEADLPALIDDFVQHCERVADLIHLVLQVHVNVVTESCDLKDHNSFFRS